jgi:hypothetical protein
MTLGASVTRLEMRRSGNLERGRERVLRQAQDDVRTVRYPNDAQSGPSRSGPNVETDSIPHLILSLSKDALSAESTWPGAATEVAP